MAQTCIVCLSELESTDPEAAQDHQLDEVGVEVTAGLDHTTIAAKGKEATTQQPTPDTEDELLAHLLPCGHNLHNECLKPWVERANSCPICRASFNKVELCARIGGPIVSAYDVADKQQEAILDPGLLMLDDLDQADSHQGPCMVCEEYNNGRESDRLLCDGCNNTCHLFCAGLTRTPRGTWYCHDCQEDVQVIHRVRNNRNAATTRDIRHQRRRRQSNPEQEWARVWQSVRSGTGIDLDFPFESADGDIEQRARIAAEQGAEQRFRRVAESLLENRAKRNPTPEPAPESQEELRAWNAFEKAKMARNAEASSNNNRRKRKSRTTSPEEPAAPEPGRTLKRPRTRKTQPPAGEASNSLNGAAGATTSGDDVQTGQPGPSNARTELRVDPKVDPQANSVPPSFLSSLLKEVEVNASTSEAQANQIELAPFMDRASSPQSPQLSSPGASPPLSAQATPRAGTPPPMTLTRDSPPLASNVIPIYPAAPEFPPFSPADSDGANPSERKNHHKRPAHRSPDTSPHRASDASPTRSNVSFSTKAEIQRMVTTALKPRYRNQELGKEEYTDINRDVSRLLYEKVADLGGLKDASSREKLQKVAEDEVETALKALRSRIMTNTDVVPPTAAAAST